MARLYYGGYGHHPSGKQYVYWGGDNYRTKQNVVVPVKNKWSGKVYRTMFTIMRTSGQDSRMAQAEAERIENKGIDIKSIDGRNVMSLPGAKDFTSAKQWAQESAEEYTARTKARIMGSSEDASILKNNRIARMRLLGVR